MPPGYLGGRGSCCSSTTKSCPTLPSHGLQHVGLPRPSLSPGVCCLMSIELVMPSNHLTLCYSLLLLPSIFSSIRVFSSELPPCSRWPKYWSISFSISPSNEYSWLISFRIDWFELHAVQGTLKSLLQHHSLKASKKKKKKALILWCSAFFIVRLSHSYVATRKIIALTSWTFVGKLMFLLFNILSRFVKLFFQVASFF